MPDLNEDEPAEVGYAYLLDDDTLDRLPRVKRTRIRPAARDDADRASAVGAAPLDALDSMRGKRDRAREHAVRNEAEAADLRQQLDEANRHTAEARAAADEARRDRDRVRDARAEVEAELDRRRAQQQQTARQVESLRRERDEARRQLVEQGEAAEEQADALRAEVARLSEPLGAQRRTTDDLRRSLRALRARAERAEGLVDESVPLPPVDARTLGRLADLPPLDEDPRRPRLDHFPTDAITLTYREVRQLLGLHLEACATAVDAHDQARAMREGETPLRLAEVLDR